jgi:hypothetical protein
MPISEGIAHSDSTRLGHAECSEVAGRRALSNFCTRASETLASAIAAPKLPEMRASGFNGS